MKDRAAAYMEHFEFDFSGGETGLSVGEEAPEDLALLVEALCPDRSPACLTSLYEALTVIAESGEEPAEIDEKVCPLELYHSVIEYLRLV